MKVFLYNESISFKLTTWFLLCVSVEACLACLLCLWLSCLIMFTDCKLRATFVAVNGQFPRNELSLNYILKATLSTRLTENSFPFQTWLRNSSTLKWTVSGNTWNIWIVPGTNHRSLYAPIVSSFFTFSTNIWRFCRELSWAHSV